MQYRTTLKQTRGLDEREVHTTKNSNKKGHFPHEVHAKNVLFIHSHQPDSLEMDFSNQPDNLYYLKKIPPREVIQSPLLLKK